MVSADVFITESEVLQPEEELTFTVSIPSLVSFLRHLWSILDLSH